MKRYYCRECEVCVGMLTQDQALVEIANGHTLFADPGTMPVTDALADASTLMLALERPRLKHRALWAARMEIISQNAGYSMPFYGLADAAADAAHVAFATIPGLRG